MGLLGNPALAASSGSLPNGKLSPKLGGKPLTLEAEEQRPCSFSSRCPLPEPSCLWPGGSCPPRQPWSPRAGSAYTALAPSKVLRHSCFLLTQAWSCVPCPLRHNVPAWRLHGSSQPSEMVEAEEGACVKYLACSSLQVVWGGGAPRPADSAGGVWDGLLPIPRGEPSGYLHFPLGRVAPSSPGRHVLQCLLPARGQSHQGVSSVSR